MAEPANSMPWHSAQGLSPLLVVQHMVWADFCKGQPLTLYPQMVRPDNPQSIPVL